MIKNVPPAIAVQVVPVEPACGSTISVGTAVGFTWAMYCTVVGVGGLVGAVQIQLDAYGQLELTHRFTPLTLIQTMPPVQLASDEQVSWQPTIGIGVLVGVGMLVGVVDGFGVAVAVGVGVLVGVGVGVLVGVAVGVGAKQQTVAAFAAVALKQAVRYAATAQRPLVCPLGIAQTNVPWQVPVPVQTWPQPGGGVAVGDGILVAVGVGVLVGVGVGDGKKNWAKQPGAAFGWETGAVGARRVVTK